MPSAPDLRKWCLTCGLWLHMAAGRQPRYAYLHCASGEVPVMTGPQDPAAAGRGGLRAGHADREQAIDTLKTAFMHGQLTKDELDARAGQALAARTYADLAALTADIPPARSQAGAPACPGPPPAAGQGRRPVGRLPDHRGHRRVGLGSPRCGRRPLPRHLRRQSFL